MLAPLTQAFVRSLERFVKEHDIPMILFEEGQRKDDIAQGHFSRFPHEEGAVFVGKAQEKAPVFRTEKRRDPQNGMTYPWIVRSTAMVNQYYFYGLDEDFGPFFLKFCSYFPYTAKLCINGHEYLKRQLDKAGISYEALDNGILTCNNPDELQRISNSLTPAKINKLLRKWLAKLPHPFTPHDRRAGYRYDVSILQAEFSHGNWEIIKKFIAILGLEHHINLGKSRGRAGGINGNFRRLLAIPGGQDGSEIQRGIDNRQVRIAGRRLRHPSQN